MGTETIKTISPIHQDYFKMVKLNNPQMGTETCISHSFLYVSGGRVVKLNNPQMGTETIFFRFYVGNVKSELN